uniref:Protein kinase domain-containing protein n=1 Tax=Nothoprocta perdicaria TaxID=30464 RepID=A0A8C6ZMH0_NOTPE
MYILLSGNPPFYEEADEDDYENHDKNLFRKILAGDYEFDPPYWDDISQAAKELVTRLMEVEQDQRITAAEAISHEWISGNAASDKNIKEGVCAQIEKNFARAKWKVGGSAGAAGPRRALRPLLLLSLEHGPGPALLPCLGKPGPEFLLRGFPSAFRNDLAAAG